MLCVYLNKKDNTRKKQYTIIKKIVKTFYIGYIKFKITKLSN